jgi:Rieske Fe-S protein
MRANAGGSPAQVAAADATRRRFLFLTGTTSIAAGVVGFLGATARYLLPNVLYEPPSRFSIGHSEDFPPGAAVFLPNRRVFVFNSPSGFYVISSVCTHLGCNVRHVAGEGFTCPCHGSRFDVNGQVISGPAPRSLAWFGMSLSPREELVVDERRIVEPDFRFKA